MKTFFFTLLGLLLIIDSRAQDTTIVRAVSFYETKMLPPFRETLVKTKQQLSEYAGNPNAVENYNMEMANVCAGLLMYDSALYYIQRELVDKEIKELDFMSYSFLFLMSKDPGVYKTFLNSVFFGKYNNEKTTGRKKFVRSEICMAFIERKLLLGILNRYDRKVRFARRSQRDSVLNAYNELRDIISPFLERNITESFVLNVRLPQYSKDGVLPAEMAISGFRSYPDGMPKLLEKRLVEMEKLIEQKDIENSLSKDVDRRLISLGKPQRYGTVLKNDNGKFSVQAPHDNLQEIETRRKLAGLSTIKAMIEEEEKWLKDRESLQFDDKQG